jgi:hypothetical protein
MSNVTVNLDLSGVEEVVRELKEFQVEVQRKVGDLASQTHLHIKEQVQQKLNARRQMYDDALSRVEEVSPGVFVITLDRKAVWIEEGMDPHSMVDDLLRNGAKIAKDGSRYKVIPFDQGKGGASQTVGQNLLNQALRVELKKRNIPYKSIERAPDGTPKSGLLHKFNILDAPNRPAGTEGRPGFGKGAVGEVLQGPNAQGGSGGGTPLLKGVRIYQSALFKKDAQGNQVPDLDKKGKQKATRSIMTFRVVSSKHKGIKWNHPGIEGTHFFEEAETWAGQQWEQHVLPDIVKKFDSPGG